MIVHCCSNCEPTSDGTHGIGNCTLTMLRGEAELVELAAQPPGFRRALEVVAVVGLGVVEGDRVHAPLLCSGTARLSRPRPQRSHFSTSTATYTTAATPTMRSHAPAEIGALWKSRFITGA